MLNPSGEEFALGIRRILPRPFRRHLPGTDPFSNFAPELPASGGFRVGLLRILEHQRQIALGLFGAVAFRVLIVEERRDVAIESDGLIFGSMD